MDKRRCDWCLSDPLYIKYHDEEWGVPLYDDQQLFEFLILETFQAGLSWFTILKKREHFRQAFDQFDFHKIANYTPEKMQTIMNNKGVIRNRLKIKSATSNAKAFIKIQKEFGSFSDYIWSFVDGKPIQNKFGNMAQLPAKNELSTKISVDLKKRGFKFVGPTIVYAHMQATGMVNDHLDYCYRNQQLDKL